MWNVVVKRWRSSAENAAGLLKRASARAEDAIGGGRVPEVQIRREHRCQSLSSGRDVTPI
jgi:hypothetical protein